MSRGHQRALQCHLWAIKAEFQGSMAAADWDETFNKNERKAIRKTKIYLFIWLDFPYLHLFSFLFLFS